MKEIEFIPKDEWAETLVPGPKPARHYTPSWMKKMPMFYDNNRRVEPIQTQRIKFNTTAKMCVPFTDTFNFGYIQATWCDMYVHNSGEGRGDAFFSAYPDLLETRNKMSLEPVDEFYKNEFAWKIQWIPKLPKGYSILYTHPLNHYDLPFHTLSGIVDSDEFVYERDGNHPFLIREGFEGFIPKGTPMFQIIPFKRDNWKSVIRSRDPLQMVKGEVVRQDFWGGYKKLFWKKKTFK